MAKASGLKIGFCLLAVLLLAASSMQASFAKQVRAHHVIGSAASAPPRRARSPSSGVSGAGAKSHLHVPREAGVGAKGKGVGEAPIAKGANPNDTRARDTIDARTTVPSPRPGFGLDKARNAPANLKIGAPGNFQARHLPSAAASNPVARNAIGLPVARHEDMNGRIGERFGSTAANTGGFPHAQGGPGGTNIGHPAPIASANILSRGKIDGTALIRPPLAPSGLGGPAKAVAGINGTTLRPKR